VRVRVRDGGLDHRRVPALGGTSLY
jgi:hypothetical protein